MLAFQGKRQPQLLSQRQAPGISYAGCLFSEPVTLDEWQPPAQPGLYAVLAFDQAYHPRPYRPIFFGELSQLADPMFPRNHYRYPFWCNEARDPNNLLLAWYATPGMNTAERRMLESRLVEVYDPACNRVEPHPGFRVLKLVPKTLSPRQL